MRHVSTDGIFSFLRQNLHAKVLDVRCAHERAAGGRRLEDHHVPWYRPNWEPNTDFLEQVLTCISPDDYVLVMCSNGQLSCKAAALLEAAGFSHVYNVLGGYADFRTDSRCEYRNAVRRSPSPT